MLESYLEQGDARECIKKIPDNSIHLVITSPPYWNAVNYDSDFIGSGSYEDYIEDLLSVWKECERVLKPGGKLCIITPILPIPKKIINNQNTRHIKNLNNDIEYSILTHTNLKRFSLYIWQKQTSKLMFGSYPYPGNLLEQNTIEFINVFIKDGKPEKRDKKLKECNKLTQKEWIDLTQQIWFIYPEDVSRKKGHPAPFPEKLVARLIRLYTYGACDDYPGDIVLDPFCGSGTTAVVCKMMKRRYICFDVSGNYINYAKKRIEEVKETELNYFIGRAKYPTKQELEKIFITRNLKSNNNVNVYKYKKISYGTKGLLNSSKK
jgi:DNA modification methylase